jgi:rhamnosyltransferase subunit B
MNAILTPVGSAGDVNPFVMLGRELRRRGHGATIMAPDVFRDVVTGAGLAFASTGTVEDYDRVTRDRDLWDPRRGTAVVFREMAAHLRGAYRVLEQLYESRDTMLVGHSLSFFTRVFEEKHAVASATVHLAPSIFRSDYRQPAWPSGQDLTNWPRFVKRAMWWIVDRLVVDRHITPALNSWRSELGLPPVSRVLKSWLHSPQRVIGLFPEWFGEPQPDWPSQTRLTGFVLSDDSCSPAPAGHDTDDLERFLTVGDRPIVFTPGTANRHAATFFRVACDATAAIQRRALFVTRYREHLPTVLPPHVCHVSYASFSTLFPRAAVIVHHGGIGTCAQGIAAGVPQLVVPMGFDQPDNGARLKRLSLADVLLPSSFSSTNVASAITRLTSSEKIATACLDRSAAIRNDDPIVRSCDLLEQGFRNRMRR